MENDDSHRSSINLFLAVEHRNNIRSSNWIFELSFFIDIDAHSHQILRQIKMKNVASALNVFFSTEITITIYA